MSLIEDGLTHLDEDYDVAGIGEIAAAEIAATERAPLEDTGIIKESGEQEYDPLKAYLKSIRLIPLLTKEEEVAVARQIEACKFKIFSIIFTIPFALNKLVNWGRLVKKGEAQLSEFVQDLEDLPEEQIEAKKERFSRTTEAIHSAIRRMEKQKNAGAAKLLPGQHRILVKIQDLNLKDSAVRSFSEEFRKIWEDFEHCRASGSG